MMTKDGVMSAEVLGPKSDMKMDLESPWAGHFIKNRN